ncbi:type IV secretory system conjugative DNA transfer family protein [Flexithrix dorotheae]|uniref:type IV secretory system conjugative DNA transfer family protein n=1 Tax=Flexithrix dorotheae TaxID=70993 RepID=UPI000369C5F8|nr:TraM recognition domain-containing protein [Flexithrix dorotheae]
MNNSPFNPAILVVVLLSFALLWHYLFWWDISLFPYPFAIQIYHQFIFPNLFQIRLGLLLLYPLVLIIQPQSFVSDKEQNHFPFLTLFLVLAFALGFIFIDYFPVGLVKYFYPIYFLSYLIFVPALFSRLNFSFVSNSSFFKTNRKPSKSGFNLKTQKGYLQILHPEDGIEIVGGAGAGKTMSIIDQLIHQAAQKDYAAFIYDYKYPELTNEAFHSLEKFGDRGRNFYTLNFSQLDKSHRVNPIHPEYMPDLTFAHDYALAILTSLKKEWVAKKDFWAESAILYLKCIFFFLRKNHPQFCDLPHAVLLALSPFPKVLKLLCKDSEIAYALASIRSAMELDAENQLAGMTASLQNPIGALYAKNIFWVFSGNDFSLDLNDPKNPSWLCVGNWDMVEESISPTVSLVATVVSKLINQQGKQKCLYLCDEIGTLYIPNLEKIPKTGRSRGIVTAVATQDYSVTQLAYQENYARALSANLGNKFFGMVNDFATAKLASDLFGKEEMLHQSFSAGTSQGGSRISQSQAQTQSLHEKVILPPSYIQSLEKGHFVGKVTGKKGKEATFFDEQIKKHPYQFKEKDFDGFVHIDGKLDKAKLEKLVDLNFQKIHLEVEELLG